MSYTRLNYSFQNDVLDTDVNTNVKYVLTENADNTISLQDVSVYDTYGDAFDASTLNHLGEVVDAVELGLENAEDAIATNTSAIGVLQNSDFSLNTSAASGVDHDLYQLILGFSWEGYVIE